jgi:hypothetical protein
LILSSSGKDEIEDEMGRDKLKTYKSVADGEKIDFIAKIGPTRKVDGS